jgi:hypothetical protein
MYKNKYLKYKNKYLELKNQKNQIGGSSAAAGDKDNSIIPFFIDLTNLIKPDVPNEVVPQIINEVERIVNIKGTYKFIKEKRSYVIKIENLIRPDIIDSLFSLLSRNNIIIYIVNTTTKAQRKPIDMSEVKSKMSQPNREKIAFKFYYDNEEHLLEISGFLNLKNISHTYRTLYKCDYNFTNVQYKARNDSFIRITTIFDSGNDAITLVDDKTIQTLGLKRYGINIQPINIMMFNEIVSKFSPDKKIDVDVTNPGELISRAEKITIQQFITNYINPNSSKIREINKIPANENNEDLLELFGFTGFKGIGGKSKISKEFVFLAFRIEGVDNKFYTKAEINNNIDGVLFSKNDMASLEQQGLSFGYFEKFKEKHENLNKLKERRKTLIAQYELSKHLTNPTIFGNTGDIAYQLRDTQAQIDHISSSETTPVVSIYDTLPVCRSGVSLSRSISLGHTEIEYTPNEEQKEIIVTNLLSSAKNIKQLLIDMIISNQFTEEQLKKMNEELDKDI